MVDALNIRPTILPNALVLTVAELKTNFLFGVNFLDDDGNEFPDSLFEFYIRSAQEWFQREVQVLLFPTDIVSETHDYEFSDFLQYGFLKLHHLPVRSVSRYDIKFPMASQSLQISPEWFRCNSGSGVINLIPVAGSISNMLIGAGGGFLPMLYGGNSYVPMVIEVDYAAGFKNPTSIPNDIREVIGMKAAMGPFNIAGDLLGGAGIASKSLSLDGLSESISTTSSPEFSGYGARINQYIKQIPLHIAAIKQNLIGIQMVVA